MKKRILAASTFASCAILITPALAYAEGERPQQKKPGPIQQHLVERSCEELPKRVDHIKGRLEKRHELYEKHQEKINKLVKKAKDKGIDVSKIEADLKTWQDTQNLQDAKDAVRDKLKEAHDYKCGDNKDDAKFRQAIAEAKELMKKVGEVQKNRHEYFKQTIIPQLKAIRDQLKKQ